MRFLLDEMVSATVERLLADRGVEARAVVGDPLLRGKADDVVLANAIATGSVLVTANVPDFRPLAERAGGHAGMVYLLRDVPRSRFAWLADELARIAAEHGDLRDRELWL